MVLFCKNGLVCAAGAAGITGVAGVIGAAGADDTDGLVGAGITESVGADAGV